ncbi:MAG: hypothetical protein ACREPA_10715 [Candidatus Dormibacteraceae bacterium]
MAATAPSIPRSRGAVRSMAAVVLFLLIAQFLLGMAINLFVRISRSHPGANADYFGGAAASLRWVGTNGEIWLRVHAALGALLLLAALVLLVRSIIAGGRGPIVTSSLGLFGIFSAAGNGASFLVYAEDFSSMLMSAGFALAVAAYAVAVMRPVSD